MQRDLRKRAENARILRVFEDRSRLVEFSNGRRMVLPFSLCPSCKKERPAANFTGATCDQCRGVEYYVPVRYASNRSDGVKYYRSQRYARLREATPPWVDRKSIQIFHDEARKLTEQTGIEHHVDHIWPIVHEDFCGLNVPWNLRVVPAVNNKSKRNKAPLDYVQQITSS